MKDFKIVYTVKRKREKPKVYVNVTWSGPVQSDYILVCSSQNKYVLVVIDNQGNTEGKCPMRNNYSFWSKRGLSKSENNERR